MVAQFIGYLGVLINLIIYQQKTRNGILVCKLISDVVWAVHFFMLGAMPGFCVACIGIARETVFIKVDRRSTLGKISLIVFVIAAITSAIITWENALSILPCMASVMSVVGFYLSIPKLSRILAFPISFCMGFYSFSSGSWAGVSNEILTIMSSIIGILRLDVKKNKKDVQ